MIAKRFFSTLSLLLLSGIFLFSQDIIKLKNPSFYGIKRCCDIPERWIDCGFDSETPPDIQPGSFGVIKPPYDGDTYLGMVVRDNRTWEIISQKLRNPMEIGNCYEFRIHLCQSGLYMSGSRMTNEEVNYVSPCILRIWGGNRRCDKQQLLAESDPVTNKDWEEYRFSFQPLKSWKYFLIEVSYIPDIDFPYAGHILLDNASSLVPISCESN